MISFEPVYRSYPNHKMIGIESIYFPGAGWTSYFNYLQVEGAGLGFTHRLQKATGQGATHVQLILQHNTTMNLVWPDFSLNELNL
ncbi:hypothetical protein BH10BAC3_BH10BAC3_12120 [soil metagenome]